MTLIDRGLFKSVANGLQTASTKAIRRFICCGAKETVMKAVVQTCWSVESKLERKWRR
jgi:hypothetical protein